MPRLAVLGLGSNMPLLLHDGVVVEPSDVLDAACRELSLLLGSFVCSSVYCTKAMYYENQSDFYNMVVCGTWESTPQELLAAINVLELKYGRNRTGVESKGPRTLDIDIELFGTEIVTDNNSDHPLFIPHSLIKERQFVLVPLLEILPDCADPITGMKYLDILSSLPEQGVTLWKRCKK